jgi:hypothetical protein
VTKRKLNPEQWFLRQVEACTHRQPSSIRTPHCVDDAFLKSYAEQPTEVSLSDRRVEHITSCGHCLGRLLELRATRPAKASPCFRHKAAAEIGMACLRAGGALVSLWNRKHPASGRLPAVEIARTLDLSRYGSDPGGHPGGDPPLSLPAARLRLEIILPRESQPGAYCIMVAADEHVPNRVAWAKGIAVSADPRMVVTVSLDLSEATPGKYALSTRLQSEDGHDTYPLQIQ